ncbi:MAG: hypothetical protein OEZ38_05565 [Gammaproteobacteria bacterium]|nr:hypothetical protein [Gammaproteobacteria bacterium]
MNNVYRILVILFITHFALACQQMAIKAGDDNYPYWVINPEIDGFVAVSASAPKQNMGGEQAQRRVALTKARQQLAEHIRVRVQSEYDTFIEESNGKVTINQDLKAKMQSRVLMDMGKARILNEWVDPASGELFIHYVTDAVTGI